MSLHLLSFARIMLLDKDIAEVIVNEGVELTETMVAELHQVLLANLEAPFSILVNKIHEYRYTSAAQFTICDIEGLNAIAMVTCSNLSRFKSELFSKTIPRGEEWNMSFFSNRDLALTWLQAQQDKVGPQ